MRRARLPEGPVASPAGGPQRPRRPADDKLSCPFKHGGRYFVFKKEALRNQSVLYTMDSLDGPQRVFMDPNLFSDDGTVALHSFSFSHSGRYMGAWPPPPAPAPAHAARSHPPREGGGQPTP